MSAIIKNKFKKNTQGRDIELSGTKERRSRVVERIFSLLSVRLG